MGIIIDTSILIYFKNATLTLEALDKYQDQKFFISSVTISELLVGVELANSLELQITRSAFVEAIISRFPALDFNADVARTHSKVYAHMIKNKRKSETNAHDLIIGSTALTHGYSVLTNNSADFKSIPGLKVVTL